MRRALLTTLAAVLVGAACGADDEGRVTLAELERELVCPTCSTTLGLSNAPVADRMRAFIRERISAGASESEIKAELVAQFGEGVLAAPPKEGFNLLAWVLPLAAAAAAVTILAVALRRWSRSRDQTEAPAGVSANGRPPLDPELERRVDDELARFDG